MTCPRSRASEALLLCLMLMISPQAEAHSPDLSTVRLVLRDGGYDVEIDFLAPDLDRMLSETMAERQGVDLSQLAVREEERVD